MSIRRDETFFEDTETPFVNPPGSQSEFASPTKAAEDKSLASEGNIVSGEKEADDPC